MSRVKRWNNISGSCLVSGIYCDNSDDDDDIVKEGLRNTIEPEMGDDWSEPIVTAIHNVTANKYALEHGDEIELVIDFLSNGYHDPGRCSGPPEDCYPPEGEDEREIEDAHIRHYRDGQFMQELGLPKSIYGDLGGQFETAINEVEIEKD